MAGEISSLTEGVVQIPLEGSASGGDRRDADWDVRQGPKNYLVLVGAQAASAFLAFAAVWVATQYLGPAGYGGVVAIVAASQLAGQLTIHWTGLSLVRYGCDEFIETGSISKTFWARLFILLSTLFVVAPTFPFWLPPLASWLQIPSQAYPLVVGHFVVTAFWIHVQHSLQGVKLPRLQAGLLTLERALIFLVLMTLGLGGKADLYSVTWAYVLSPLVVSAIGLWRLRKLVRPIAWPDRVTLKRILVFSFPLLPSALISYFASGYLDAFFITHFLSVVALGVYSIVYQLSGTILQLPLLAGTLLLPLFISTDPSMREERISRFISYVLPLLTLVWSLICAVLAVIAGYLVPFVFGPKFSEAVPTLWPLMASAALAGPVLMGYFPISNTKAITYVTAVNAAIAAVLNVGLNLVLIPRFGLLGCAWATLIAFVASLVVTAYLIGKHFPASHNWAPLATMPAMVGAIIALWTSNRLAPLVFSVLVAIVFVFIGRASLTEGLVALSNVPALKKLFNMRYFRFIGHFLVCS
ncbi:MAG TPA: oligosaccharide flippase family protein [Pyrinomonadaceae bacterium]|nr:oligosaccharide flippase family protein [Pyrinomonadaceae bacterium]